MCILWKQTRMKEYIYIYKKRMLEEAWDPWTNGPIATITTTTIVCLPGSRQGIWARSSTMNQAQTPGWPPWPGIRHPNRIKRCPNARCSPNLRRFRRPANRPSPGHRRLDPLNPSAVISVSTWDPAPELPVLHPRLPRPGKVCSRGFRAWQGLLVIRWVSPRSIMVKWGGGRGRNRGCSLEDTRSCYFKYWRILRRLLNLFFFKIDSFERCIFELQIIDCRIIRITFGFENERVVSLLAEHLTFTFAINIFFLRNCKRKRVWVDDDHFAIKKFEEVFTDFWINIPDMFSLTKVIL